MDGANPYLPPQASIADGGGGVALADGAEAEAKLPAWRLEGRTLFARHGATLPDICLLTGEPTTPAQRLRYLLSWTPIWLRVVGIFTPQYGLVAYCALRRTSTMTFSFGASGRRRQRLMVWLIVAAVIDAGLFLDGRGQLAPPVLGLLLLGFVGLVIAALCTRVFRVIEIDRRYARLRLTRRAADAFARLPAPPPSG